VDTTTDKLIRIRTPRMFCKIDQFNYENSAQQIWLCTQYSLKCQN